MGLGAAGPGRRVRGGWGPPQVSALHRVTPSHSGGRHGPPSQPQIVSRASGEGGWRWAGIPTLKVVSSAATDPRPPYWAQGTYLCRISGQRRGSPKQQHPSHARARLSTGPGLGLCSAQGITTCVLGSRAEQGGWTASLRKNRAGAWVALATGRTPRWGSQGLRSCLFVLRFGCDSSQVTERGQAIHPRGSPGLGDMGKTPTQFITKQGLTGWSPQLPPGNPQRPPKEFQWLQSPRANCSEVHSSLISNDHSRAINCEILMRKFGGSVKSVNKKQVYCVEVSHFRVPFQHSIGTLPGAAHLARPHPTQFLPMG